MTFFSTIPVIPLIHSLGQAISGPEESASHHIKHEFARLSWVLHGFKPTGLTPDLDTKLRKVTDLLGKYGWRTHLSDFEAGDTNTIHINTFDSVFFHNITVVMLDDSLFQPVSVSTSLWAKNT